MIAQSLENVLQNKQSSITPNTWTLLSMLKRCQNYNGRQIRRQATPKKDLWILANSNNQ
jgi:hypothetical protein